MDLISVIVPVYKVEKYLDRCIESIVNQTYTNLEIILVDDGSPDKCPEMCDEWAKKDSRIKVVHTTNGGSARARNVALEVAKGEYIVFCDSDDMMHGDMINDLHGVLVNEQADIVECDYSSVRDDVFSEKESDYTSAIYDTESALTQNIRGSFFNQIIWNKIYKSSVIRDVRFVEGKTIDDEFWTYRAIGNARKLVHIDRKMYYYRQQSDSIMHQPYSKKRLVAVEAHVKRHEYVKEKYPNLVKQSLIRIWFDCRYHGQMAEKHLTPVEKKNSYTYLKAILKAYPLKVAEISSLPLKEKVWLLLEAISLPLTCNIRNLLNIGF